MRSATEPSPTRQSPRRRISTRSLVLAGLAVSVVLAIVVSVFASTSPDGLEHVAETLGFAETGRESAVADSPLADYGTAGVENEWLSSAVAALVGLALTGLLVVGLLRLLVRPRPTDES